MNVFPYKFVFHLTHLYPTRCILGESFTLTPTKVILVRQVILFTSTGDSSPEKIYAC